MTLHTLIAGVLLGISFCMPVGPVTMETLRRGLRGGFRPALALQLGSIIGDTTFCVLAFLGLAPLVTHVAIRVPLWILGAAVLAYLGIGALRDARRGVDLQVAAALTGKDSFRTGAIMSLTNPLAILWWVSIGGAMLASGITDTTPVGTASFVSSFVLGCTFYAFFMAALVGFGRQFVRPTLFRTLTAVSGIALVLFGAQVGWQAATTIYGMLG
ncbi:MAG: LysE family transporter [Anaerolineae bacterium]